MTYPTTKEEHDVLMCNALIDNDNMAIFKAKRRLGYFEKGRFGRLVNRRVIQQTKENIKELEDDILKRQRELAGLIK